MTELLKLYVIFALTTGITSCVFLFWPTLKQAKAQSINNEFTRYPIFSAIAYTCIASIFAPVLFLILSYPPACRSYIEGLSRVIKEQKS